MKNIMTKKENLITIVNKKEEKGSKLTISLNINSNLVEKSLDNVTEEFIKVKEIKGFRKGKAPKELVFSNFEEHIKEEAYKDVQNKVIEYIYEEKINPLRIYFEKDFLEEIGNKEDIKINVLCYTRPKIDSIDISKIKVSKKKAEEKYIEEEKKYESQENKKILEDLKNNKDKYTDNIYESLIIEEILNTLQLNKEDIPEYMIKEHVSKSLKNLEEFSKNLELSLDEYLKQVNTTKEKVIKDLEKELMDQLKLDVFTENFAEQNKIEVNQKDIDDQLKTMNEDDLKKLNADEFIYNIRYYKSLKEVVELVKKQS